MAQNAEAEKKNETLESQTHKDLDKNSSILDTIKIEITLADVLYCINNFLCTLCAGTGFLFLIGASLGLVDVLATSKTVPLFSPPEPFQTIQDQLNSLETSIRIIVAATVILTSIFLLKLLHIPHTRFDVYFRQSWGLANDCVLITLKVTIGLAVASRIIEYIDENLGGQDLAGLAAT